MECAEVTTNIPDVPFQHFAISYSKTSSAESIFKYYSNLLTMTKGALQNENAGSDYNLILVSDWMVLIPRRSKGQGHFMANAANMVGLMWLKSEELRQELLEMKLPGVLASLGIPICQE